MITRINLEEGPSTILEKGATAATQYSNEAQTCVMWAGNYPKRDKEEEVPSWDKIPVAQMHWESVTIFPMV